MAQSEDEPEEQDDSNTPSEPPEGTVVQNDEVEEGFTDIAVANSDNQSGDSGIGPSAEQSCLTEASVPVLPVQTTDLFSGPYAAPTEGVLDQLVMTTTVSHIARRHTSLDGCPGLDPLSLTTVHARIAEIVWSPGQEKNLPYAEDSTANQPKTESLNFAVSQQHFVGPEQDEHSTVWSLEESFQPFSLEHGESDPGYNKDGKDAKQPLNLPPEHVDEQLTTAGIHDAQMKSGTWSDPEYPKYVMVGSRMATYPDDPVLDGVRVNSRQFAESGFFYNTSEGFATVICYHCGCSPRVWEQDMDPKTEHVLLSPRCKAVYF